MNKYSCQFKLIGSRNTFPKREYGNTIIYTVPAKRLNVVVSPEDYLFVKDMEISKYHNTALTDFPKEINNGKNEVHYGYQLKFDNDLDMKSFLLLYKERRQSND